MDERRPLTREALDRVIAGGCQMPGCNHSAHDHALFLTGRCHPNHPVKLTLNLNTRVLRLDCGRCGRLVGELALFVPCGMPPPPCGCKPAYKATYQVFKEFGSPDLGFLCGRCRRSLGASRMASEEDDGDEQGAAVAV